MIKCSAIVLVMTARIGRAWVAASLAMALGCGDDGASNDAVDGGDAVDAMIADRVDVADPTSVDEREQEHESPWTDLAVPVLELAGGGAMTAGGVGGAGGDLGLNADGPIVIDPALAPIAPPALPAVPAGGAALTSADLAADVSAPAAVQLSGALQSGGVDPVRTIVARTGDLVLDGTLRAADLGARTQSISLRAPQGTVFVTGTIDTRGSSDRAGGAISIHARRVVIQGRLLSYGGSQGSGGGAGGELTVRATAGPVLIVEGSLVSAGADGVGRAGNAGDVRLQASADVHVHGDISASGGDARGSSAAIGGAGGIVAVVAGGDIVLERRIGLRGGAALDAPKVIGGDAGDLRLDAAGNVRLGGMVDGRGGLVSGATGGDAIGGRAGGVIVGNVRQPARIQMTAPASLRGGDGIGAGGTGGVVDLAAAAGDLRLVGRIDSSGGASQAHPGDAGGFSLVAGPVAGGVRLIGPLVGEGGAGLPGGAVDGGAGAIVTVRVVSLTGPFVVAQGARLTVDGGAATADGRGGPGGDIDIRTRDGDASMAGQLRSRGGVSMAPGGRGGIGGSLNLWTDTNANGIGGHLVIEPTGVIDVSGGAGSIGGHARNNGGTGVALFPIHQDQIAVLLNSETYPGPPDDGSLSNLGVVIATGGGAGGWGGDVMFHGRRPNGREDPEPGMLVLDGDGNGENGDFAAE